MKESAHLLRGAFYVLLFLAVCVIPFALGQQSAINSGVDPAKMSLAGRISSMSEAAEAQPSNSPHAAATAVVVWDQYNNAGTAVTLLMVRTSMGRDLPTLSLSSFILTTVDFPSAKSTQLSRRGSRTVARSGYMYATPSLAS